MTKGKKLTIVLCVLALVIGALWFYWERPISLGSLIPQEEWTGMDLEQMLPENLDGDIRFEEVPMEDVLALFESVRVTRAEEQRHLDDECFRITLYKAEAWPTVIYVGSTGRVDVAADMQYDDWKCYEGGEALYLYLSMIAQTLPALLPAA